MAGKNKKAASKAVKKYIDLLYMTPSEIKAKDIVTILQGETEIKTQLWEEMNVLELELANSNSMDLEPVEPDFKDPSDSAFVKNRNIKTIFAIQLCEEDLNTAVDVFEKIIAHYSGFLCADTIDFSPVYAGSSQR